MTGQLIGYVRVSSADQNPERQLEGVKVDRIFFDKSSGKNSNRPELSKLISYIRNGDVLIVHSMDRLARNLTDLRKIVNNLTNTGVKIRFIKEGLEFSGDDSAMATLMLSVMGAFSEFERELIRERQREGIALAKLRGVYTGRKRCLSDADVLELKKRFLSGEKKTEIAKSMGISRETLYQYMKKL